MLLMFGVGIHFSFRDLLAVRGIAIPGAIVQSTVATVLGIGLSLTLGWGVVAGIVLGLSLSVASTVVLLRALIVRNALDTIHGRVAVGWLIVEDIFTVLVLVPRIEIVARVETPEESRRLMDAGASQTVEGERELAVQMARYTLRRFGVTAREVDAIAQGLRRRAEPSPAAG